MNQKKENGLGCVETGSQSYLSGLLGFDDFEKEDYDSNTEEDLKILGIEHFDFVIEIENFFKQERQSPRFNNYLNRLDKEALTYINGILQVHN